MKQKVTFLILGAAMFFSFFACAGTKLKTVPHVDLKRYMGDWNVIANIPNFIEKGCISSIESYALREDGKIDNWFVCKKADGHETKLTALAWVHNSHSQAEWRVRFNLDTFFGKVPFPVPFKYYIIDLDPTGYNWTVVGSSGHQLLWIMSRDRTMDDKLYLDIISKLKNQGYDISKIVKLPQSK